MNKDQRKHVRIASDTNVAYVIVDDESGSGASCPAISKNISCGGLQIFLARKVPMQARVKLEIYIPSCREPVEVVGQVVWQEEFSSGEKNLYSTGIKYISISDVNKAKISRYILNGLRRKATLTITIWQKIKSVFGR